MPRTVDPARHAARRAAIRDAAAGVFAERGYDGASTDAIRRAAGVGSGTLFHYFGDKRSLMVAIFEASQEHDAEVVASLHAEQPVAELWRLLDHVLDGVDHPLAPGLVVAMLQLATRDAEFAAMLDAGDARLRAAFALLVAAAQQAGHADGALDPARAGRWLVSLTDALYLMVGDDDVDAHEETTELHRLITRYLGLVS